MPWGVGTLKPLGAAGRRGSFGTAEPKSASCQEQLEDSEDEKIEKAEQEQEKARAEYQEAGLQRMLVETMQTDPQTQRIPQTARHCSFRHCPSATVTQIQPSLFMDLSCYELLSRRDCLNRMP